NAGSIETIIDDGGLFTAPAPGPDDLILTTGADTFAPTAVDSTVTGTADTLNAADDLDAGTGTDALILYGGGTLNLNTPVDVDGFEEVQLVNLTNETANLTLRSGVSHDQVTINSVGTTRINTNGSTYVTNVTGGSGNETIFLYGASNIGYANLGDGSNHVRLRGTGGISDLQTGSGLDRLYVYSTSAWSGVTSFDGGGGSNDRLRFFQSSATF
ncbi:hypothetical protein, partial [Ruegeria sp. SCP11]|uniref:hypothetical protein n=1 Tax=Ruegeria sp. SCP11 TaxID=3141378 RepID=UPI003339FA83